MIYQISGSFLKRRWEVKCLDMFIPPGVELGVVKKASAPFDYTVFLEPKGIPGNDVIIELLVRARSIINNYICNEPGQSWYKDLGQI